MKNGLLVWLDEMKKNNENLMKHFFFKRDLTNMNESIMKLVQLGKLILQHRFFMLF